MLGWPINIILRRLSKPRYSVRVFLIDLQRTGVHLINVRPEGGDVVYNLDNGPPNPSPKEYCRKHTLRDGTYIIFPFDLDDPNDSDEVLSFCGPPDLDSDGNEVHSEEHSDESSEEPYSIDSDGHVIVE
jgi:hypothetical protein